MVAAATWHRHLSIGATSANSSAAGSTAAGQGTTPDAVSQTAGVLVFLATFVLILRDRWKWLPLGRAGSTLLGACAMVVVGALSPARAFGAIHLPTLALLFGCMLIGTHMERQGVYAAIARMLDNPTSTPVAMLWRVSAVSACASALLTNDTLCVILPPIVLRSCLDRPKPLNPLPCLIAIATSANIGSACSPIGNPQNMVIALLGGVYFSQYLGAIGLAAALGVALNSAWILWVYKADLAADSVAYSVTDAQRRALGLPIYSSGSVGTMPSPSSSSCSSSSASTSATSTTASRSPAQPALEDWDTHIPIIPTTSQPPAAASSLPELVPSSATQAQAQAQTQGGSLSVPPVTMSPQAQVQGGQESQQAGLLQQPAEEGDLQPLSTILPGWRRTCIRNVLYALPLLLAVADRWIGLGWMACAIGALLCALDGAPPEPLLKKIDALLLLFFAGLFVVVDGFNSTGVPAAAWSAVSSSITVTTLPGLLSFSLLVLAGSNTVSNVPLVLLLADKVPSMSPSSPAVAWLLLAWTSTVAGNLTLLGSVANLIVAERSKDVVPLSFGEYTRVGAPSTVLLTILGVPLVALMARWVV